MKLDGTVIRFIIVGVINTLFGTAIMFVFYNVFHLSSGYPRHRIISSAASSAIS